MQQAPADGRGIFEMIVDGGYRSLDLSPFSRARIAESTTMVKETVYWLAGTNGQRRIQTFVT